MKTSPKLELQLKKYLNKGILRSRIENNKYLKVSYKGTGNIISEKWNVKIYTSGSIVCVDTKILNEILNDNLKMPDVSKALIQCDDAGWGFPLLGCMVGVTDGKRVETDVVDVSYFQNPAYEKKEYLKEYTRKGYDIITKIFKATPDTHRIEICSGYINKNLRFFLRDKGFDVDVVEIKGLLQDNLERLFREYIHKTLGKDLAYDPKVINDKGSKGMLAWAYKQVLNWGYKNTPHLLKSGWKSIGDSVKI